MTDELVERLAKALGYSIHTSEAGLNAMLGEHLAVYNETECWIPFDPINDEELVKRLSEELKEAGFPLSKYSKRYFVPHVDGVPPDEYYNGEPDDAVFTAYCDMKENEPN